MTRRDFVKSSVAATATMAFPSFAAGTPRRGPVPLPLKNRDHPLSLM
ncbi:MAG: twin-arginine translocation signal domain-containing protein [Planctomycetota bacterium]